MPNPAVKPFSADGTPGGTRGRVGRCRKPSFTKRGGPLWTSPLLVALPKLLFTHEAARAKTPGDEEKDPHPPFTLLPGSGWPSGRKDPKGTRRGSKRCPSSRNETLSLLQPFLSRAGGRGIVDRDGTLMNCLFLRFMEDEGGLVPWQIIDRYGWEIFSWRPRP